MEFLPAFKTATVVEAEGEIRQRKVKSEALTDEKECQTTSTTSMLVDVPVVSLVREHFHY